MSLQDDLASVRHEMNRLQSEIDDLENSIPEDSLHLEGTGDYDELCLTIENLKHELEDLEEEELMLIEAIERVGDDG
jgi:predicted  nucleic acid-binding Zn-ribbon protein